MSCYYKTGLLLILISIVHPCFSQQDTIFFRKESSSVKIGYNSSLIYPGAVIGMESPMKITYLNRKSADGEAKQIIHSQFLTSDLSWYHHPGFHDNVYLTIGWTWRRIGPKGWFWDFSPKAGLSRTFLGGTTYKIDEKGNVSVEKLAGYNYALVSPGGGAGYDFAIQKGKPFQLFCKFDLLMMFPYNSTIYLRPAMELGMSYKFPEFFLFKTKIREINQ
jgi:hypothetical protein